MRRHLVALIALIFSIAPVAAADMPIKVPAVSPVFSWAGPYLGGHIGYVWTGHTTTVGFPDALDCGGGASCEIIGNNREGFQGGVHVGYNWQFGVTVVGIELEGGYIDASGTTRSIVATDHVFTTRYDGYGALTGRMGWAADRTLLYLKAGVAAASIKNEALDDFPTPDPEHIGRSSKTRWGFAVGAGGEYAFTSNWILRFEYMFTKFEHATVFDLGDGSGGVPPATIPSPYRFKDQLHSLRLGVSYKF